MLILYVIYCILNFFMSWSNQLFFHDGLCSHWISSKSVKFLLSGVPLHYFKLSLDVILHDIFEFSLELLRLPKNISELGCDCLVHSFLDSSLWLFRVSLLRLLEVSMHMIKQFFHSFLVFTVNLNYLVYLLSSHYNIRQVR